MADVFRRFGAAWRAAQTGPLDRGRRRVMAAIEACRTARLGGYVEACGECGCVRTRAAQPIHHRLVLSPTHGPGQYKHGICDGAVDSLLRRHMRQRLRFRLREFPETLRSLFSGTRSVPVGPLPFDAGGVLCGRCHGECVTEVGIDLTDHPMGGSRELGIVVRRNEHESG